VDRLCESPVATLVSVLSHCLGYRDHCSNRRIRKPIHTYLFPMEKDQKKIKKHIFLYVIQHAVFITTHSKYRE